ncbi:MAG: YebC/PmpR family DNA-binding transcriptional regulator [Acholeplasmataceae bacterium]|nr:MAG: YebC/PmpR family DNA-binding transcriptional regulator [Acholeplasmataceae bacterium]
MGRAFEVRKVAMAKTAAVKSKLYAKYGKEIYMAAKSGNPDPENNQSLKRIIERAKRDQVSADIIKRAIDKAQGGSDESYTSVRYEGFGPGNSQFIVECLTDNVNRAIAEVRNCFTKTGGKLGISGSVIHQFNHLAVFALTDMTEDDILNIMIEKDLDIKDLESDEQGITIYGEAADYNTIRTALVEARPGLEPDTDTIAWLPITEATLESDEERERFEKLLQMLDEIDDVQEVYHNIVS